MTVLLTRATRGLVEVRLTTGGSGYTSTPTVTVNGAAASTASVTALMAGTRVESLIIAVPGSGYTQSPTIAFSGGGGTGASAVAVSAAATFRPMSFFKGRFGTVYGVDGMGRGIRWDGVTAKPIGLHKPAIGAVTATAATTGTGKRVSSIQMVDGGRGYSRAPTVTLTGGGGTGAQAQAAILNGSVVAVQVVEGGSGYTSAPEVSFQGGFGSSAALSVGVLGSVNSFLITSKGSGYTSSGSLAATIGVATSQGLTGFQGIVSVQEGEAVGVIILSGGTGATAPPTFTIAGGTGSGASVTPVMEYRVDSVTAAHTGNGSYMTPPFVTIRPAAGDPFGGGASVESAVSGGHISTPLTVVAGGRYTDPPTALIIDTSARAQASVAEPMRGKYLCAIRYIDSTEEDVGGPLPSSISHLVEVDATATAASFTWNFAHGYVDDRVTAMELWRTSGDQEILLYRVATIQKSDNAAWAGPYIDTMKDTDLTDAARVGYGLMPITLPSGQINARRFEVPPGRFAIGAMFQDRAWYAFDATGRAPNSLYYSEIDEPESVPDANELVVQENTGMPDAVVGLVPLGSMLLVAQSAHLYRLMYVAQPIIDASITLVANRGVLNNRCWAVMAGVAFLADSTGMYAFDGNQEQSISVAVDNFWRDGIIDFSQADKFHVDADYLSRTVRFYYCRSGDAEPVRALCYSTATQAWWEESYPTAITATTGVFLGRQLKRALGTSGGGWRKESGAQDGSAGVQYQIRTGNMALIDEPDRSLGVLYKPTTADSNLNVSLFYNNSVTARDNAIQSDRGTGFTVTPNGPATINMKKTRSPLGDATGAAFAHHSGRKSERSAGGDQHVAVQLAGTQGADQVTLYGVRISGAT